MSQTIPTTGWCEVGNCTDEGRLYRRDPDARGQLLCDLHAEARGFKPGEKPVDREIKKGFADIDFNSSIGEGELVPAAGDGDKRSTPVQELDAQGRVIGTFGSINAAAKAVGVWGNSVADAIRRRRVCRGRWFRFLGDTWTPAESDPSNATTSSAPAPQAPAEPAPPAVIEAEAPIVEAPAPLTVSNPPSPPPKETRMREARKVRIIDPQGKETIYDDAFNAAAALDSTEASVRFACSPSGPGKLKGHTVTWVSNGAAAKPAKLRRGRKVETADVTVLPGAKRTKPSDALVAATLGTLALPATDLFQAQKLLASLEAFAGARSRSVSIVADLGGRSVRIQVEEDHRTPECEHPVAGPNNFRQFCQKCAK